MLRVPFLRPLLRPPLRAAAALLAVSLLVAGSTGCGSTGATDRGDDPMVQAGGTTAADPAADGSTTTIAAPITAAPTTVAPTTSVAPAPPVWPSGPVTPVGPSGGMAPVVSRVKTTDPVIFLTIDDGMLRDPRVPQFLAEHHIPVTLFLNEGPLKADPDYFAQFTAMGDVVESHTRTHPRMKGMGLDAQKAQICGMATVIDQQLGHHGHLFRPPFGSYDDTTRRAAAQCGDNAVVTWRAALNDGMVQIQNGDRLVPGDIVLSHFRPDLYDDLVVLWAKAQEWGLSFAALEAYLPPPSG
jgi:peptidoglycan/xylan/chitin deacetylase (PgdA/CDA1 family)